MVVIWDRYRLSSESLGETPLVFLPSVFFLLTAVVHPTFMRGSAQASTFHYQKLYLFNGFSWRQLQNIVCLYKCGFSVYAFVICMTVQYFYVATEYLLQMYLVPWTLSKFILRYVCQIKHKILLFCLFKIICVTDVIFFFALLVIWNVDINHNGLCVWSMT